MKKYYKAQGSQKEESMAEEFEIIIPIGFLKYLIKAKAETIANCLNTIYSLVWFRLNNSHLPNCQTEKLNEYEESRLDILSNLIRSTEDSGLAVILPPEAREILVINIRKILQR